MFGSVIGGLLLGIAVIYANGSKITLSNGLRIEKTSKQATMEPIVKASQMPSQAPLVPATVQPSVIPSEPNIIESSKPTTKPTLDPTSEPSKKPEPEQTPDLPHVEVKEVKSVYISSSIANNNKKLDSIIEVANNTEVNAFVFEVKDESGYLFYDLDVDKAKEIGAVKADSKSPAKLLEKVKAHDIYTIARIVVFKDPILAKSNKDYAIQDKNKAVIKDKGEAWVNPYNEAVWDYEQSIIKAAVAAGFDEVQLDYVRFNTNSVFNKAVYGDSNATKTEVILDFTKKVKEVISPLGGYLSMMTYGTVMSSDYDALHFGQDFTKLASVLDYICPMVYPSSYHSGSFSKKVPDQHPYDVVFGACGYA